MPFPGEDCSLAFFEGMSVSVLQNSQTDLQAILDDSLFKQLVSSSTIRDQARLRALSHSSGTSSGWLKALPQPALGLAIPPHDFTIALRLWLGIPLFPSLPLCTCLSVIDQFGDHLLGCSHGPLRIQRHNALVSVVHHALLQDHPGVLRVGSKAFHLIDLVLATYTTLTFILVVLPILISPSGVPLSLLSYLLLLLRLGWPLLLVR